MKAFKSSEAHNDCTNDWVNNEVHEEKLQDNITLMLGKVSEIICYF